MARLFGVWSTGASSWPTRYRGEARLRRPPGCLCFFSLGAYRQCTYLKSWSLGLLVRKLQNKRFVLSCRAHEAGDDDLLLGQTGLAPSGNITEALCTILPTSRLKTQDCRCRPSSVTCRTREFREAKTAPVQHWVEQAQGSDTPRAMRSSALPRQEKSHSPNSRAVVLSAAAILESCAPCPTILFNL